MKDVVDVILYFLDCPQINGIFNVGTGQAQTWNALAESIFKAVNKKPEIDYIDMPEVLKPIYQYFTQADMDKLRKAGYSDKFMSLEDAIKDYSIYLNNQSYL